VLLAAGLACLLHNTHKHQVPENQHQNTRYKSSRPKGFPQAANERLMGLTNQPERSRHISSTASEVAEEQETNSKIMKFSITYLDYLSEPANMKDQPASVSGK
jgi:hypothetical protein